jgi:multidrug resistance efflux pump
VGGLPSVLVFLAAVAGFLVLSHGAAFGTLPIEGFAETIDRAVAPITAGRIADVRVTLGQEVKAGDVLAELDRRQLEATRDVLRAALAKAQAQLEAQRGIQEMQVMRAELWALRARAAAQGDRAELGVVEKELKTFESLSGEHLVSELQVIQAMRQKETIGARVEMYDAAVQRGQAGLSARYGELKLSHAQMVTARLAPFVEAVHASEAELRQAELNLEEATLKAPGDGRIAAILHRSGEVVGAGTEVITIASGRPGAILVTAPERVASRLSVGTRVKVRPLGFFRRAAEATVIELSPQIDQAPPRAWAAPQAPLWGRRIVVHAPSLEGLLPGEGVYVQF